MCSPPPRDKANQEAIWHGLVTGVFDVFLVRPRRLPLQ